MVDGDTQFLARTANQSSYSIVDEPRPSRSQHLVVNPMIIFLVAMLGPLFWTPPFFGRYWLPFVWVILNGHFLGSPSIVKEILISMAALVTMAALFFSLMLFPSDMFIAVGPYFGIALSATFFAFLYWVVFSQYQPWSIHSYIKTYQR